MITKENFKKVLGQLNFTQDKKIFTKIFGDDSENKLVADFENESLTFPENLKIQRQTITNFSAPENFVVFECIARLLDKGYSPENIELESPIHGGHHDVIGYSDIRVTDNNNQTFLIIECKKSDEFDYFWNRTLKDGSQLFNYFNSYRSARALCLYTSDFSDDAGLSYKSNIISLVDNEKYLTDNKNLKSFKEVQERGGLKEEFFDVWAKTYNLEFDEQGIFEKDIEAYTIGKLKYTAGDLIEPKDNSIQKKYNEFATIMRRHNVGSHENSFDKLVNLFLAKIVDETYNPEELKFRWKGVTHDDYFSLQDRLQKLYKIGMEKFLNEEVTYIDNNDVSNAFHFFKNDPDATRDKILEYFRRLKFFTNNDFAFLDVHNEKLFYKNSTILKEMVQMLQNIKLKTAEQNQFLGDLFEGFLDKGIKQSEGQYFTPLPIVKFLVSSLPLEKIISESDDIPFAIDYACGVGHFLTEYAEEIKKLSKKISAINPKEYNARTVGIEKEYRLSKVAKVSAFMYGHNEIKIIYGDALTPHENLKDDNFSVLVANPPYSVKGFLDTLTEDERNNFTLSKFVSDTSKNNSIETFFVERAKQLLKSGGVAAIILPVSILTNENIYEPCREIILKYFKIVAIVQLGSGTFGKTGTNTVTLFLQRRNTVPDDAEHYKNRVDAWFKSDDTKNKIFCDNEIIKNYCNFCKINFDEYKNWLTGDCLPTAEIFHAYVENFKNDSEYKKIARKNVPEDVRTAELEKFINNKIKSSEKKKLFYFWLASDENSDSVVIVKAPDSKDEIKKFLGYEWSNSKGSEGIKYIGAAQNIISEISTPLFNPNDFDDVEKINLIIRKNFIGENISVPDSLADFVSIHRLRDLINFTNVDFNKAIKLTPTRNIVADEGKTIYKLNSRDFEISIGKRVLSTEIVENGKYPVFSANVFKEFGRIDKLNIDDFSLPSVIWGIDGDWMVNVIPANIKFYPTDHCGVLRVRTDKILTEYLAFVLRVEGEFEKFSRSNRASIERIKSLSVQIPPLDVQQKIISRFNAIDSAIKQREQNILKLDENIKNKFAERKN